LQLEKFKKMSDNNLDKAFKSSLIRNATLEFFGIMCLVLAFLAKNDTGLSSLPFFENESVLGLMIVIGGTLVLWANYQIISLIIIRARKK